MLKWSLFLHRLSPKFCWSDGCLENFSSKIVQSSAEVMVVFKDCHQRLRKLPLKWWLSLKNVALPKLLLKWWLSLNIVIKDLPKFCGNDGCLFKKLLLKIAENFAEVMAVFTKIVIKDFPNFCWNDGCLQRFSLKIAQSSAEMMAVLQDYYQRLSKVLLKWCLSLKNVIKDCAAQISVDMMATIKDYHQRLPKILLKRWISLQKLSSKIP